MSNKHIFYDQYVSGQEKQVELPLLFRLLRKFEIHRYEAIRNLIPRIKKHSVLDIGCGSGEFLRENEDLWLKAMGIDIVPEIIEKAKKKSNKEKFSYQVFNSNLGLLPFSDESFSLVVSIATLQYVDDLDTLFLEVHRVLKEKGTFIFEVPNFLVFWRRIQLFFGLFPHTSLFHTGWDGGVLHYFSYNKTRKFVENKNFNVVSMSSSGIFSKQRNILPSLLGANMIVVCQKK